MIAIKSQNSVSESVDKIESFLKDKGVAIFARIDHKKNAQSVNLEMPNAEVIIFGNPALGTSIMKTNIDAAYDLPLRIAVVERSDGVYIIHKDVKTMLKEYGFTNEDLIQKATNLMNSASQYGSVLK